jgi:hypothetical protein
MLSARDRSIRTVDKEDEARAETDNTRPDQSYLHKTVKEGKRKKRGGGAQGRGKGNGLSQNIWSQAVRVLFHPSSRRSLFRDTPQDLVLLGSSDGGMAGLSIGPRAAMSQTCLEMVEVGLVLVG